MKRALGTFFLSLILAGVALAILAVAVYVIIWRGQTLATTLSEEKTRQVNESAYRALLTAVDASQADRQELSSYVLRSTSETIALLSRIERAARALGLEITTQELKEVGDQKSGLRLSFSFAFKGDERAVSVFVSLLETLPYHGNLTALSLSRSADQTTGFRSTSGTVSLELTTYSYER